MYGVHRKSAETAAVSRGISHVTTNSALSRLHHSGEYSKTERPVESSRSGSQQMGALISAFTIPTAWETVRKCYTSQQQKAGYLITGCWSLGAVWKSSWPSWVPLPVCCSKPDGFYGRKATLKLKPVFCGRGEKNFLYIMADRV